MMDDVRLPASGFTITIVVDVSPALRALLAPLRRPPAPGAVSPRASDAAGKRRQPASEAGSAFLDGSFQTAPAAEPIPPPAAFAEPPRQAAATRRRGRTSKYDSPERLDYLRLAWPDGILRAAAMIELNKLPGAKLSGEWVVTNMVKAHDIKRSPEVQRRIFSDKVEAMRRARGLPSPAQPPAAPPPAAVPVAPAAPPPAAAPRRPMQRTTPAPARPAVKHKPIAATSIEILRWGAEHGCRQDTLDLDAMNAHRRKYGVPEFELVKPQRRAA